MRVLGYLQNESSGVLRPAVEAYLAGGPMTDEQIAAMRSYLRQWIAADWCGADVELLRMSVDGLTNRAALDDWLDRAIDANIDPI